MVPAFVPVLSAATVVAGAIDVRVRRIPNILTGTLAVVAIALSAYTGGWRGAATAIVVIGVVVLVGLVPFSFGLMGGGDIKLLAAACGGLSPVLAIDFLVDVAICGGVLSVLAILNRRFAVQRLATDGPRRRVPYGAAIAAGALILWVSFLWPAFFLVH